MRPAVANLEPTGKLAWRRIFRLVVFIRDKLVPSQHVRNRQLERNFQLPVSAMSIDQVAQYAAARH